MSVPLNQAMGQTHAEDIFSYVRNSFACIFQDNQTGTFVAVYVVFNILWNISILMSVKHSGALATFVALKAIFPVSTLLFAYVDWPLLGKTSTHWLVWVSVLVMLPSIAVYQWASDRQNKRQQQHPTLATCCWPLCIH